MMTPVRFTDRLWSEIESIFAAILAHPFITGLTSGQLDRDRFLFYVVQDALYLREFARALSVAAAKAPREDWIILLDDHAAGALRVERALHEGFFREVGLTEEAVASIPMAPTNVAYTSYLLAVAYGRPFPEVIAALLPCYWIYWEVGKALQARGSPDPLFQRWIETYAAEQFGALVRAVLDVTDELAQAASPGMQEAMRRHFITTARYEWMFWEMGYRKESWPV
jgi:thiaminase/transcriptional activator TenA